MFYFLTETGMAFDRHVIEGAALGMQVVPLCVLLPALLLPTGRHGVVAAVGKGRQGTGKVKEEKGAIEEPG